MTDEIKKYLHDIIVSEKAIELLKTLIQTPSISRSEDKTADVLEAFLVKEGCKVHRKHNNVWVFGEIDPNKKTVLLNSHHDTVKPVSGWTRNPFSPDVEGDKLFGLGSNDAGGSLVSLLIVFLYFCQNKNAAYNLIFAATAEEEVSGDKGIESILDELGHFDFAIVGEPTQMQAAIAEKGLLVLDCIAHGKAGHAARNDGENAILTALNDIQRLSGYEFEKKSDFLGDVKVTATQINGGTQHNIIPDQCNFVLDVRVNEMYSNSEVFEILKNMMKSEITARSFRLNSSFIDKEHEIVKKALNLQLKTYGSPTLSDQAHLKCPSLKMGPGSSERSHTANEYIGISEIEFAIKTYIALLMFND